LEADFDLDRDEELDLEGERDEEFTERPRRDESQDRPPAGERTERGGRRRRRGRRGSGRDREQPAQQREADYGQPEFDEEGPALDRAPAAARSGRRDEPRSPAGGGLSDIEDPDDLVDHEAEGEEHASGAPTHKRIPTWDEAVGLLIEANMAARANSPERESYRGGRGRGGRGRGGRGR
jgi:hypothetical protein